MQVLLSNLPLCIFPFAGLRGKSGATSLQITYACDLLIKNIKRHNQFTF